MLEKVAISVALIIHAQSGKGIGKDFLAKLRIIRIALPRSPWAIAAVSSRLALVRGPRNGFQLS
jgi:hypothetical protein